MKKILIPLIIVGVLVGAYFLVLKKPEEITGPVNGTVTIEETNLESPDRPAEVNGTVLSVEGNVILIANEVGKEELPEEERDARQEERQNLTQEERQALRQEALEEMETEDLELVIPVGVPISKGSGDSSGGNVSAEISEITKGTYLSIWLNENNSPEFVKIKGLGE